MQATGRAARRPRTAVGFGAGARGSRTVAQAPTGPSAAFAQGLTRLCRGALRRACHGRRCPY
ncbi:MAG: hypothetical protein MUF34_14525 [Polyangiaceae bacterium]|nr:hypothetical protein [Polyangiaceae bacterium]